MSDDGLDGEFLFYIDPDEKQQVRANISVFEGVNMLEVRKWLLKRDGTWVRTQNGLNIPANKARKLHQYLGEYLDEYTRNAQARRSAPTQLRGGRMR